MSGDSTLEQLQELDALAAERGAVLAFRVCEDSDDFEPVLIRIHAANPGADNEMALVAISDRDGLSLGRYVIPRDHLERALGDAEDVDAAVAEPVTVPSDWEPQA